MEHMVEIFLLVIVAMVALIILITTLKEVNLLEERLFQESQVYTRNPIERCFGGWKRRFSI